MGNKLKQLLQLPCSYVRVDVYVHVYKVKFHVLPSTPPKVTCSLDLGIDWDNETTIIGSVGTRQAASPSTLTLEAAGSHITACFSAPDEKPFISFSCTIEEYHKFLRIPQPSRLQEYFITLPLTFVQLVFNERCFVKRGMGLHKPLTSLYSIQTENNGVSSWAAL